MATAEEEPEFDGGTATWFVEMLRRGFGALVLPFVTTLIFASPALYLAGHLYSIADPFMWLGALGLGFLMGRQFIVKGVTEHTEDVETFTRTQLLAYMVAIVILGASMFSTLIGGVGVLAAFVAANTGTAVPGVIIALAGPAADIWVGERTSVSLAVAGLYLGVGILKAFEVLAGLSSETSATAQRDARRLI